MRRLPIAATPVVLIALTTAGCLEGDPNPFVQGTSGSVAGTSGAAPIGTVEPGSQCSTQSAEAVSLTFKNNTTDRTVNLFWVDFTCREVRFGTFGPGGLSNVQTFVTHPWRLRDASTNALYKEFTPTSSRAMEISIP